MNNDESKTNVGQSQAGVIGNKAKVEGGVHYHQPPAIVHKKRPWYEAPLIVTVAIAFLALLLTIILCVIEKKTDIKGQITLAGISPSLLYIVIMLVLAITYRSGIRIIIFVLIPLLGTTTALESASYMLDKPVFEIIEIMITSQIREVLPSPRPDESESSSVPSPMEIIPEDTSDRIQQQQETVISQKSETEKQEALPDIMNERVPTVTDPDFINSIGMEFMLIPAGSFLMGSPESEKGRFSWETQHRVTLTKDFYIQTTEVTQEQWKAVMGDYPPNLYFRSCGDDCPVELVSWNDVQEFIRKLNETEGTSIYRLPTEAEWEYACRAGSDTAYCFGNDAERLKDYAWYGNNSGGKTHPVAQKQPNAWGLYDMHGNVWEWCQDWYGKYPTDSVINPTGPDTGSYRVNRGGGYFFDAQGCRSAYRNNDRAPRLPLRQPRFPSSEGCAITL